MWDIGAFYQQAWQIVKKNKFLWVFGAALGGAGGMNLRSLQNFHPDNMQHTAPQAYDSVNQVLGTATASSQSVFTIVQTVPLWLYFLLGLEILLFILFAVGVAVVFKAWTTGILLEGVERGIKEEHVTIEHASQAAFTHLRPLLWLQIVPWTVFGLGTMGYFLITSMLFVFGQSLLIISIPILLIGLVLGVVISIRLLLSSIWAPRLVMTHHMTGQQALKQGYVLTKKRFWPMVLLGIVNFVVSLLVSIVPVALLAILVFPFSFLINKDTLNFFILLIPLGAILGVGFIVGMSLIGGICNAFKATVWSLASKGIKQS